MHEIASQPAAQSDFALVRRVQGWPTIKEQSRAYLQDESQPTSGACDAIFFPRDETVLAAVVREMTRQGVPLRGGLVSLERLSAVEALDYAPYAQERRVRAQCAVTLSDLNRMAVSKRFPDLERRGDQKVADLAIVGDAQEILPRLLEEMQGPRVSAPGAVVRV